MHSVPKDTQPRYFTRTAFFGTGPYVLAEPFIVAELLICVRLDTCTTRSTSRPLHVQAASRVLMITIHLHTRLVLYLYLNPGQVVDVLDHTGHVVNASLTVSVTLVTSRS